MFLSKFNPQTVQHAFLGLADALCPPSCLCCEAIGARPFCHLCENALLHFDTTSPQALQNHLGSLWLYGGPLSLAFGKTKFSKQPNQMKKLLVWLLRYGLRDKQLSLLQQTPWDVISWVPAHPLRRVQRGFNTAYLLATFLGDRIGLPRAPRLQCVRNDEPFSMGSAKAERQKRIQGRYRVLPNIKKEKILLVDDICTTGATLSEASKQLTQAGARVHTFTLAQTPKQF